VVLEMPPDDPDSDFHKTSHSPGALTCATDLTGPSPNLEERGTLSIYKELLPHLPRLLLFSLMGACAASD
jgi:hypothetical protein